MNERIKTYKERAEIFRNQSEAARARYNRLAFVRLIAFIAAILLVIYLWSVHWLAVTGFVLIFIAAFYRFIQWHQGIQESSQHLERLARINEYEQTAIRRLFVPEAPWTDGEEFVNPDHPYTLDLDIFGAYSFFQYINRNGTAIGRRQLAGYLEKPARKDQIGDRQEAIRDLSRQLDWRQNLQAYGLETDDEYRHVLLLKTWLDDKPFVSNNSRLRAARYLIPLWMTAGLFLWAFYLPWQAAILFLIPPAYIIRRTLDQVNHTHNRTAKAGDILSFYARLIEHIEEGEFRAPKLAKLQSWFAGGNKTASANIHRLSYIIGQLNVRYNFFAVFLNLFALWDLQWIYKLERWKEHHHTALSQWFDALAEFEALGSLATAYYNNPDWSFPTLTEDSFLSAQTIGHPLIHPEQRVCNDLQMPTKAHIKLITGSNMAGKSTFLRTVGLNIVLAMSGAPVCGQHLQLPFLRVYTSMRTQDALHESTSSFYAELKRLKFIIEAVDRREKVFFLLDEILKGTNSRDRHTGSKALIQQLIQSGGGGLIATHDLELGQLEGQYGGAIENLCIEVETKDGELVFDYKLKKGVSQSFNATQLMRNMGIKV